jgi:hypothetical protein
MKTMKNALTRKRKLPRILLFLFRGLEVLFVVGLLGFDLRYLAGRWRDAAAAEYDGWLSDYADLKTLIQLHYPGLDWAVTEGGLDLHRLDARTTRRLQRAKSRREKERILGDFMRAFHDGHLALLRPEPEPGELLRAKITISASTVPATACEALGYEKSDDSDPHFDFSRVSVFHPLPGGGPFPATVARLFGRSIGLLRIPSFGTSHYGDTCASEWERFRADLRTTCESACRSDFRSAMTDRLLDELGARIGQMRDEGVDLLAVDLRGNHGGSGTLAAAAAELLAGRPLPDPATFVIADRGTVVTLEREKRVLSRALALCPGHSAPRRDLEAAYWSVDRAIAEAGVPCDRSGVWSDWGVRPSCSGLVPFRQIDDLTAAEFERSTPRTESIRAAGDSSFPARPRWRGRLAVLTDNGTGSAAEQLAGVLQDYHAAAVVGRRTAGAGGGWMLGRGYWELRHSHLRVYIPDHASFRRDGTSYQAGIAPDVPAAFEPDGDETAEARAFVEGLPAVLDRQSGSQSGSRAVAQHGSRPGSGSRGAAGRTE